MDTLTQSTALTLVKHIKARIAEYQTLHRAATEGQS